MLTIQKLQEYRKAVVAFIGGLIALGTFVLSLNVLEGDVRNVVTGLVVTTLPAILVALSKPNLGTPGSTPASEYTGDESPLEDADLDDSDADDDLTGDEPPVESGIGNGVPRLTQATSAPLLQGSSPSVEQQRNVLMAAIRENELALAQLDDPAYAALSADEKRQVDDLVYDAKHDVGS